MKTRRYAQVGAGGEVLSAVESSIPDDVEFDALPAGAIDITDHPDRVEIEDRRRVWHAASSTWKNAPALAARVLLDVATATDRELLEAVARAMGLAR